MELGNIISSKKDDDLICLACKNVFNNLRKKYYTKLPDNWDISLRGRCVTFPEIRDVISKKFGNEHANKHFPGNSRIEADSTIICLEVYEHNRVKSYPLFIGEMKKQGTNEMRMKKGLPKQGIGNAACDRIGKNYTIFAMYCYCLDEKLFPYNVFIHGCDFSKENITTTTLSKLTPFFGTLNEFHPWFDNRIGLTGGTCYYQKEDFTCEQLYKYCYKCCKCGIEYYLKKFNEKLSMTG